MVRLGELAGKLKSPVFQESLKGSIFNIFSILFSVLTISFSLKYLGKSDYGIWVTVYSICNWITFLDGGLGNGVRNELTFSLVEKDVIKTRSVISTGYISLFLFLFGLFLLLALVHLFFDWNTVLSNYELNHNILALFVFGFFLLQMVVKLISKIYFSFGRASLSFLIPLVSNFLILASIYLLYVFNVDNKLWNIALIFSLVPLIVFIFFSIHFFVYEEPKFKPAIKFFEKRYVRSILTKGVMFFMIQMGAGLLQAIAPFFITLWFSSELTAEYQVSMRYYSVLIVFQNIILQTMWTSITKSFASKDTVQLSKFLRNKIMIAMAFSVVLFVMWLASNYVYKIWIGEDIVISARMNIVCAIFVATVIISKSFTNFLNAINDVKIQSMVSVGIILLYLPLVYLSVKIIDAGVEGLILVPALFFILQAAVAYKQVRMFLNK